jgi:hypothetical protein
LSYATFWGAVIEQAALDLLHPDIAKPSEEERDNALAWVKDSSTAPAGYLWACDVAGIDPAILVERLKARGWL